MQHSNALKAACSDQSGDANESCPHVGGERVELPVHGCIQGSDAPGHMATFNSMCAYEAKYRFQISFSPPFGQKPKLATHP